MIRNDKEENLQGGKAAFLSVFTGSVLFPSIVYRIPLRILDSFDGIYHVKDCCEIVTESAKSGQD